MRAHAFALVETLIALTLGLVLLAALVALLATGRQTHGDNEHLARADEAARTALDLLASEARNAGHYGLAWPGTPIAGATPAGQPEPAGLAVGGRCIASLALDVAVPIAAADGGYALDAIHALGCAPGPLGRAVAGGDTLTLRRVATRPSPAANGRLQLESTPGGGRLLADGRREGGAGARLTDVEVGVFYVSADSSLGRRRPSLRRKRLVGGAAPAMQDEELVPGIADLQVEFGLDRRDDGDRAVDAWSSAATVPGDADLRALRLWVLAESDEPDGRPVSTTPLRYANREFTPPDDRRRRVLATTTVWLRNVAEQAP